MLKLTIWLISWLTFIKSAYKFFVKINLPPSDKGDGKKKEQVAALKVTFALNPAFLDVEEDVEIDEEE